VLKGKFFVGTFILCLLTFSISIFTTAPGYAASSAECKLDEDPSFSYGVKGQPPQVKVGFPLPIDRVQAKGTQDILVLPIDFPGARTDLSFSDALKIIDTDFAKSFYYYQSGGKLNLHFDLPNQVFRMPETSAYYGNNFNLFQEGISSLINRNGLFNGKNYVAVITLVLGKPNSWSNRIYALTYGKPNFFYGQTNLRNIIEFGPSYTGFDSVTLVHEFGHLLGFRDFYSTGYGGFSSGPFDVMAYQWESSKTFLGWNQWLATWIADEQVICLGVESQGVQVFPLSEVTSPSTPGHKIVVIKETAGSAVVIESRKTSPYDELDKEGLLVYRISTNRRNIFEMIPHQNELTTQINLHDAVRFKQATVGQGQYVRVNQLLIENRDENGKVYVYLHWGKDATDRQFVIDAQIQLKAKAAADLKAKQEAEAKAAAELKAKQEAEAKAAAELKAKQEAEAKAAAELKAKQEAEAKAAAELKAKQEAAALAAANKKITITCIKGKTVKRVTAVKPKCPSGYKKK
jgi:hypothetical protein